LPDSLRAKQEQRRRAEEELSLALSTLKELDAEMDGLRSRLKPLENSRLDATLTVLCEHGEGLAAELSSLNARRFELRQALTALGYTRTSAPGEYPPMVIKKTAAMEAALAGYEPEFFPGLDPLADMGARWRKRLDALIADPDAEITTPKPIKPSDYSSTPVALPDDGKFHMPQFLTRLRAED
jgi:hypothetical protein